MKARERYREFLYFSRSFTIWRFQVEFQNSTQSRLISERKEAVEMDGLIEHMIDKHPLFITSFFFLFVLVASVAFAWVSRKYSTSILKDPESLRGQDRFAPHRSCIQFFGRLPGYAKRYSILD